MNLIDNIYDTYTMYAVNYLSQKASTSVAGVAQVAEDLKCDTVLVDQFKKDPNKYMQALIIEIGSKLKLVPRE